MDFPIFHLEFFGDRMLIAVIGALHVLINHAFAVGGIPLVVALEWWGHRTRDPRWDELARQIMFTFFVIATTVGALTGVGIWLSVALINPEAIGSLLRVFFWAWFTEWLVFVTEVVLILIYYLTWKRWSGELKGRHLRTGLLLSMFSWITMALIVAILGFMMNPGRWLEDRAFLSAVFNDIYLPQLAFRTALAMFMSGCAGLFLVPFFAPRGDEMRTKAVRFISLWTLAWTPVALIAGAWYVHVVPQAMFDNIPVALGTQAYAASATPILWALAAIAGLIVLIAALGASLPALVPRAALLLPLLAAVVLAGAFERTREFVRKPYVIGQYMYANRYRVEDYPLLNHEGILPNSTYAAVKRITPTNHVAAGHEVFRLACATCHTVDGVNGIDGKLSSLYRGQRWTKEMVVPVVTTLHNNKRFMPPFPGNEAELDALAEYLVSIQGDEPAPPPKAAQQTTAPSADGALANRAAAAGMPAPNGR
jgi:mono/diheme cytochrome c family protein